MSCVRASSEPARGRPRRQRHAQPLRLPRVPDALQRGVLNAIPPASPGRARGRCQGRGERIFERASPWKSPLDLLARRANEESEGPWHVRVSSALRAVGSKPFSRGLLAKPRRAPGNDHAPSGRRILGTEKAGGIRRGGPHQDFGHALPSGVGGSGAPAEARCHGSGQLDLFDFLAFQTLCSEGC